MPGKDWGPLEVATPTVPSDRRVLGKQPTFADLTTMGVGGTMETLVQAHTEAEIIEAVAAADEAGKPLLMLGGGSNLVASDEHFDGTVVMDMRQRYQVTDDSSCGGATVVATAGVPWDEFVALSIDSEWMGLESLSGIPGTVGAAPVQNIGAYGHEVAQTLSSVRVYDRLTKRARTLALADLKLEYRNSLLKRSITDEEIGGGRTWGPTGRWVVLEVEFLFRHASLSAPIEYDQLAKHLGVETGRRVDAKRVREAVLDIRGSKGMVLNDQDRDTWSSGSFFTNPIIPLEVAQQLPEGAPTFEVRDQSNTTGIRSKSPVIPGIAKTSAAWLISRAGFEPGFALSGDAKAALSTKHVLAITNRGGATAGEIKALADRVVAGVQDQFGITLVPEPVQI
ncbi:UDP-N-acetylenolpyruvoylglucosamine reductase [Boudabousia tangfeifanii]|uniref:UDP-N-acetylenolpyruvoylglucosamine reductase n=1 Tax=Boudabousia tangfeifanii TaxID=1912795 RepID=A0A1D9MMA3_9ACTO|nr:UDP-N-acetylenolpyruvoylglucosamine reductase [Boudabousia tangfeifanii]